MAKPLDGIKVVDFTHVISGPYCSMMLGDMGAEVIKIEKPGTGEFYREEGIKNQNGVSIVYPNYNRNKKGIALNIKNPKAVEIIKELAAKSDIFVENQRPGLLDKLGLGFEDLKKVNPNIIYVSISGFGKTGPYTNKAAFDMTIAAISGVMSVNGLEGSVPLKTGAAFSDFLSGIYAAFGAVLALRQRDATGQAQFIDISMLESIVSVLDAFIPQYQLTGIEPERMGNRRSGFAPVNVFKVKDGYVYVAASFQIHWECLAKLMKVEHLIDDPRFKTPADRKKHEHILEDLVEQWTMQYTAQEAVELLEKNGVPCAPVKKISEIIEDEQIKAREAIVYKEYPGIGKYPHVASPIRISTLESDIQNAPRLGEHNEEVLCDFLGYTPEEVAQLKEDKVL